MDPFGRDGLCRSTVLGLVFIMLGSCRILLIKFSANEDGQYEYLPVTVNMLAEVLKLVVCVALAGQYMCATGYNWRKIECPTRAEVFGLMKWAVPGFLYFLDNLLAFYVVKYLQPAVAVLLGNFGIITTSVLFRLILKRKLTRIQWASLIILFLAIVCLSHQSQASVPITHHKHHSINHILPSILDSTPHGSSSSVQNNACQPEETVLQSQNSTDLPPLPTASQTYGYGSSWRIIQLHRGHALVVFQCVISSLANVYNEKIFKESPEESIYTQNCKLYTFGVIFNFMSMLVHKVYRQKLWACGFFHGHTSFSLGLTLTTAMYGLSVAFILKFRDNMFHLLSSQLITVTVISASIYFFHFRPQVDFFLTAPIVITAIYIYQMSRYKEDTGIAEDAYRRRIRFLHDVDEGDGFIISQDSLQE